MFSITRILHSAVLLLALASAISPSNAYAQSLFERLVIPGDLTQSHADLQKDCSNCHEDFSKGAQVQLCLECHKDINADVVGKTGFHGRSAEAQAFECNHCHTDHKGRDFRIVLLDLDTFDHRTSDFPLTGQHQTVMCGDCHREGKAHRMAPGDCVDCHREDDRHQGTLGKDCAACHATTGWDDVTEFDHSKTDFPLRDAHKKLTCNACHAGEIYEDLPLTCIGCHRIQDIHADRFGAKCETCHTETKWTEVKFDHNKDTDFSLDGAHRQATCNDCHTQNIYTHPQDGVCADCHLVDDPHRGSLGSACADCHSTTNWFADVAFDHDFTNFPLIGQHRAVQCEACHSTLVFSSADTNCGSCHQQDDKHKTRLGPACETCHNPNGWAFWIFDHDRQTNFALSGAHSRVTCEGCHTAPQSGPPRQSAACISCHARDDVHRGAFGSACSKCHSRTTFKGARLK